MQQATLAKGPTIASLPRITRTGIQPPLKWAGGKRWLVPTLEPLWQPHAHRRLVEPFVGGMAVTLGLRPERALLNDCNEHLINFYRRVQAGLQLNIPLTPDEDTYYDNRNAFNALVRAGKQDAKRAAMLFYYLNRNCYNGLCRFNQSGEFNTPHGKYAKPQLFSDLRFYREAMEPWVFTQGDFADIHLEPDDFIYADPPYDDAFTTYSKNGFNWHDQVRLAAWLARHKGPVVVSNHATDRILELYASHGFDVSLQMPAPRMINCNGDRTPAMEVIATKNLE